MKAGELDPHTYRAPALARRAHTREKGLSRELTLRQEGERKEGREGEREREEGEPRWEREGEGGIFSWCTVKTWQSESQSSI